MRKRALSVGRTLRAKGMKDTQNSQAKRRRGRGPGPISPPFPRFIVENSLRIHRPLLSLGARKVRQAFHGIVSTVLLGSGQPRERQPRREAGVRKATGLPLREVARLPNGR
jgi:hypothetical protein